MSDHGSGHSLMDSTGRWRCTCGQTFINGEVWLVHSKIFRKPPPKNWIELAVPLTGVTILDLVKFLDAAAQSRLTTSAPIQVTTRQGVGNDKWQTYVVLRADRDTPMPDWLRDAQAQEARHAER